MDLAAQATYRNILAGKICSTRFTRGRAVFCPSFTPEASVSVYADVRENLTAVYVVSYLEVEANIYQATQGGIFPRKADRIKVRRIDTPISKQLAELISEVWLAMLKPDQLMTRADIEAPDQPRRVYTEGTTVELSIEAANGDGLYGRIIDDPELEKKTKTITDIARGLISYCKDKPSQRDRLAAQLEVQAKSLLQMLGK